MNYRIVVSESNGLRCIIGCAGSVNNQFSLATQMAFDSQGNIYVVDENRNTIQKFVRLNNNTRINTSYNQPKFCSNSTWNSNATTFANSSQIGPASFNLYIDTNNSIYSINNSNGQIIIWMNNSIYPNLIVYTQLILTSYSIFVTINGDIYFSDSNSIKQITKSNSYTNNTRYIANISNFCNCLFVDISNSLYCSIGDQHKVVKKWLNNNSTTMITIAGNGSSGSATNVLNFPAGIFVDTNFDLYIADRLNNRIQLFRLGQSNGITVAGANSSNTTITLNQPTYVILDADKYLFISDSGNHRIIASDENGFRCIVDSTANQANWLRNLAFDSFGNLFVIDTNNNRIQKFTLSSNSCKVLIDLNETTTCQSQTIILIPSGSTTINRLQFRRNQDFYIISFIEFICNDSLSIQTQWKIKNYSNPLIETTFSELYIPARSLPFGIYELELTVSLNKYPTVKSSSSAYVEITPSGITANLVQLGTSMITSGYEQDLRLDPGAYSIDLDENTFNISVRFV